MNPIIETSTPAAQVRAPRKIAWLGLVGASVCFFWLMIALFGPWLAPHPVGEVVSDNVFENISAAFPFGTDYLGRDMLSRVLIGARFTVGLALISAVLASGIGTMCALLSVVAPKWLDEIISRLMDAFISIPSKMLALIMVSAFGSSEVLLVCTAVLSYTPGAFRIARSMAVNIEALEYVQVARTRGEGRLYIACREILPNMLNPVLTDLGLRFGFIVLLLSGMSFLGLGVQPPDADLGSLVRENIGGLNQGAPAIVIPALAIGSLTIGVNLFIDRLSSRRSRRSGGH
ncbi:MULTISPECIES: ABC transporter permease [Pseudomonas syringae group]|uniref:ABC transporter permease n=2 Tax=Pseudomonas syringae group TaxID=136849 RepID=A0ABU7N652_PSEVI|nr:MULTISPECIES: ABC transporter permease [Pseudomonas syringae group]MBD8569635.1 ABC transporter permease [Pseudomonas syringae]KIQ26724.1 DNA-directed RNA polymerase subunit alpha [Pseudomonas viridiflava]KPY36084.1 Peptide ABC transporter permease [Pseudomonas syringae pv. primulae]MBV1806373.1 ABC transporter permease [Pseudomonas viridiflava]MDY0935036.1 ABC transporter permease [Pseudomonas viridiflava]